MSEPIFIKKARFILSGDRFIENKDILIKDNIIEETSDKSGIVIDGSNHLVMPGLANMHTHSPMILFRGYAPNIDLQSWLKKIWELESKLKPKHVRAGAELACLEMLRSGTTFFNDMYFFMEEVSRAAQRIGMKCALSHAIIDFMGDGLKRSEDLAEYLQNISHNFVVSPHAIYTSSEETLIKAKELAKKHNAKLHIHLAETKKEVKDCIKEHKKTPVEYLDSLKLLDSDTIAVHCCWISPNDIKLLNENKVVVVNCPISNSKLSSGAMPYMQKFCFGTDSAASNNSLNIFNEIKQGLLLHKELSSNKAIHNQLNIPANIFESISLI